jgi:hypothetical protein
LRASHALYAIAPPRSSHHTTVVRYLNISYTTKIFIDKQSIEREDKRQPIIFVNGEPTMCEKLSLPKLKALQKQHNNVLNGHSNEELVELLKQRGVLPPDHTVGRRRVKNLKPASEPEDKPQNSKMIQL